MTENIGGPSAPYNATIPSIVDNANIQTAFRLYHYGSDTSTPTVIPEESIAGHLTILQNNKLEVTPVLIPDATNLNTYINTGFYAQTNNAFAASGTNYPSPFAGLLTVVNSGSTIFQQYQVIGAAESESTTSPNNRTHWRFYYAGSWRPWRTFVETAEFVTLGDARYYTQSQANSLFASQAYVNGTFLTTAEANSRQYLLENTVSGTAYTLSLADTSKVVAINSSGNFIVTIPTNAAVPFPIGTVINIYALNNHVVTVQGNTGVTLRPFANNKLRLFGQYTEISLRKRATNEWVASGNILAQT